VTSGDPDQQGTAHPASADGALAIAGAILVAITAASLTDGAGLLGGLLALVVVAAMAAIGTYSTVVGTRSTTLMRWTGAIGAVLAVAGVFYLAEHITALLIPVVVAGAGVGRTASWKLRVLGIVLLGVAALLVVAGG
jgi:hypothetical protein